jgi:hypothetical protein
VIGSAAVRKRNGKVTDTLILKPRRSANGVVPLVVHTGGYSNLPVLGPKALREIHHVRRDAVVSAKVGNDKQNTTRGICRHTWLEAEEERDPAMRL